MRIPSSSPADARPVRTAANSRPSASRAPVIFVSTSLIMLTTLWVSAMDSPSRRHDRAYGLAEDDPLDVTGSGQIEDDDRQLVVHAERDRGGVHHLQPAIEHLDVRHPLETLRVLVLLGIGGVDAVDLGRLHDRIGPDLDGPQRPRGVRREERVAGARGEDHDATLFEVTDRAPADV